MCATRVKSCLTSNNNKNKQFNNFFRFKQLLASVITGGGGEYGFED